MHIISELANEWFVKNKSNINVALVTNLEPSPQEVHKNSALRLKERYFSHKIISQFIQGFRDLGVYTEVFENEAKYLQSLATQKYPDNKRTMNFVYNLTEPGFGAGGISLISVVSRFYGLICCNSDPHASTMGRHKFHSYCVLKEAGVSLPKSWWYIGNGKWSSNKKPQLGTKVIAKSTYESCSIGIDSSSIFEFDADSTKLESQFNKVNQPLFVQEYIAGKELSIPVIIGDSIQVLDPVLNYLDSPDTDDLLLTEDAVFKGINVKKIKFTSSNPGLIKDLKDSAASAAKALGFSGISRIDYRVDSNDNYYVIDVGAVPVLYKGSSVEVSSSWSGISFHNLLEIMLFSSFECHMSTQE
ncbi:ATP-grasp domain-containing protein [Vibrio sp. SCSIO 43132]|uniref:ATP-grasp domain-containing protein n=1 Tax=Vibrio sp. SCSIO 43132 TaxID=2779363 RepID=UPI001CA8FE1D|nr:ATP-grasp domain-containing protein [Vibrio sp. SCSIO 43132]UAB71152.1 ATP-grasp domain-containing protein [Vibrio sp. SCSIO 43132]